MEGHLNLRIQPWLRRLITRLLAIIPAISTILFFGDKALGSLLILSQVVLSFQLGFAVIPLIHFNSDKKLMKEFAIKPWVKILAWIQIGFGKASTEIAKIIPTLDADLLVMGEHGHGGFKDLVFGTTVESVRHKIKIPILIVTRM